MKTRSAMLVLLALAASSARAQEPPGYPVEQFLGVTVFTELVVSSDGRQIAFITLRDDFEANRPSSAIWRVDLDASGAVTAMIPLTSTPAAYSGISWSPGGGQLAFLAARPPELKPLLQVLDMRGGEPRTLTPHEGFPDGLTTFDWSADGKSLFFAAREGPDEEEQQEQEAFYGDVIRYAKRTPKTALWRVAVATDPPAPTRIATAMTEVEELAVSPDGSWIAYLSGPPREPEVFNDGFAQTEVYLIPADGSAAPRQLTDNHVSESGLQWSRDGRSLLASGGGDPAAARTIWTQGRLYTIDLDGGAVHLAAPGFVGELSAPFGSGAYAQLPDGSVLSAANVSTHTNLYRVELGSSQVGQLTEFRGAVSLPSASRDGRILAFALATPRAFPELYLARGIRDLGAARRLTEFNARLTAMAAPAIETIRWSNGEGDEIEGVVYWPPDQRGSKGLPLVVDIHGGPWWAKNEDITFNLPFVFAYYPALLASRGYLVLEPNYRGGTGRGDDFLRAIEGHSCSRPAIDILTGVDQLIANGWVDPQRVAVMGYSYGGLLTNCLITRTGRFRAAVSGAGLWNDISYFGTADNFVQNDVRNLGAAPWEDLENYWNESPISGAGDITTPTLITIGGADRRVPTTQGLELYRALSRLGVPAELLVFPGEGHGFSTPAHKLTKVRAEIRWIDHYLLGRSVAASDE